MTPDSVLMVALNVAYFAIFGATLLDYLRHRDPVRRSVVLVFASVALVLASSMLRAVGIVLPQPLAFAIVAALLAQPLLTLWLVHQVRAVSRRLLAAAAISFGISLAVLALTTVGATAGNRTASLLLIGLFVLVELTAASLLAGEARRRAGASQTRLYTAALATGLFGGAILVLAGAAFVPAGSPTAQAISLAARLIALVAAIGYLAAFVPPLRLRQMSQQGVVYDFVRRMADLPAGTAPSQIWAILAETTSQVTGAPAAVILGRDPTVTPITATTDWPRGQDDTPSPAAAVEDGLRARGARLMSLTIELEGRVIGEVRFILERGPLFVEDDLQLLRLIARRAAQAADRESIRIDREALIGDLRRASAAKSDFLAAMSHELRTPLNAIIGFSELLKTPRSANGHDAETVASYSGHIHDSGLHLLDLINDVLDLAKVEAGRLDLRMSRLDLGALVAQTVETMRPVAARKAVALDIEPARPVEVDADPGRIRQVVYNLVSNAIKFTPEGGRVAISTEVRGPEVRLTVSDTGVGIAPEDHEAVFEAFKQVGGHDSSQPGTGLGLALTRQLVERHGGRVELDSAPGEGSRFTVVLPVAGAAVAEMPEAAPAQVTAAGRVLVIEDDAGAAELLRVYLTEAGYPVEIAVDARAGLASAAANPPAAVLLDILLPDVDGWEVLQRLKRSKATRNVPVVVVSVLDDAELGLALGAVDYFVKPVGREALLSSLGRLTFTTKVRTRAVRVLVVDGDPAAGERYRKLLGPEGFTVSVAQSGEEGLEMAVADPPDLVVVDLTLPDLDGFELVGRLKSDERTRGVPIWAATRGDLTTDEKTRLNGHVLGVVERGDVALTTLRQWLDRVATGPRVVA